MLKESVYQVTFSIPKSPAEVAGADIFSVKYDQVGFNLPKVFLSVSYILMKYIRLIFTPLV